MNETKNFLAEIKARYPDCNILIPQSSVEQVSPFLSYSIAQVQADLSEESGDVFKVGSTKVGDSYVDQYSLSKPLLNKMAQAAGIVFDYSTMRTQFNADNTVVTCSIAGSMRRPDMTWRTEADSKTISVKDEEVKYRMEAEEKAKNGIADPKPIPRRSPSRTRKSSTGWKRKRKPRTASLIRDRRKQPRSSTRDSGSRPPTGTTAGSKASWSLRKTGRSISTAM